MASNSKEIWKQITALKGKTTKNYGISNLGNLCSFEKSLKDKIVIKLGNNGGFPTTTIRVNKKSHALFPHREVATYFINKANSKSKFVLHLDHNKKNNKVSNLKWATKKEQAEHNKNNPIVMKAISNRMFKGVTAKKLTPIKVTKLKTEIWNPKRKLTLKQLSEKYNITQMTLYRIKTGIFWYHLHVENEPVWDKYKAFVKNTTLPEKEAKKNKEELDKKTKLIGKKKEKVKVPKKKDKKKEVKSSKKNKVDDKLKKKKRK